jgi:TonB family protein
MNRITIAGCVLATIALASVPPFVAPALAAEPSAVPIHAVVDVELDAKGNILSIEPADDVAREIADFLRGEISAWEFLPATRDGRPVPTRTSVGVRLEATGERNGKTIEVRIVDAGTGPRYAQAKMPRFPMVALDRRETGEVLLRVDFDTNGRVVDVAIEKRVGRPYFDRVAMDAVREWTFQPERVGDVGLAATVFVPIRFCIPGRACKMLPAQPKGPQGDGPRLVGEPAAKIVRRGAPG